MLPVRNIPARSIRRASIEKHEGPGIIGGSRLIKGDAAGPYDGTFGWDYQGFGWHPGRAG